MEGPDALGEDLSFFWRGWFYRTDVVDQAVDSVQQRVDSAGTKSARIFDPAVVRTPRV